MSKGEAEIPKLIAEMITEHYLVQRAFCKALVIGQAIPEMYPWNEKTSVNVLKSCGP